LIFHVKEACPFACGRDRSAKLKAERQKSGRLKEQRVERAGEKVGK
jgi:hypothetical protein